MRKEQFTIEELRKWRDDGISITRMSSEDIAKFLSEEEVLRGLGLVLSDVCAEYILFLERMEDDLK